MHRSELMTISAGPGRPAAAVALLALDEVLAVGPVAVVQGMPTEA